jgi:phosphate transport system substrate-binding protein
VGVSWVGNHKTHANKLFEKVKIAQLESTDSKGSYVLPVQANIYYRRYPMIRDVVSILKEKIMDLDTHLQAF